MEEKTMGIFLENFEKREDVFYEFKIEDSGENILFAWYGYGCYDGSAFVLFERDGRLYEVNGGHCSCFGLEDQWEPEETSVEVLMHRIDNGSLGDDGYSSGGYFGDQLKDVLNDWKA